MAEMPEQAERPEAKGRNSEVKVNDETHRSGGVDEKLRAADKQRHPRGCLQLQLGSTQTLRG